MVHAFNPNTPEAEAGRSLSLRPVCTTGLFTVQPSLESERPVKTESAEDIIEGGDHVPPQKTAKLVSLCDLFMALESKIEDRGYGICLHK